MILKQYVVQAGKRCHITYVTKWFAKRLKFSYNKPKTHFALRHTRANIVKAKINRYVFSKSSIQCCILQRMNGRLQLNIRHELKITTSAVDVVDLPSIYVLPRMSK